jgi:hypothetical protein
MFDRADCDVAWLSSQRSRPAEVFSFRVQLVILCQKVSRVFLASKNRGRHKATDAVLSERNAYSLLQLYPCQFSTMSHSDEAHGGSVIRSVLASLMHHIGLEGGLIIFVHVLLAIVIYRFCLDPLRHIPGPTAARFTELWRTRRYALGGWHQDILDLHDKYGPVVRIAPNEISFVDKDALTQVYGHSTGTKKVRLSPGTRTNRLLIDFRRHHGITRGASQACRTLYVFVSINPHRPRHLTSTQVLQRGRTKGAFFQAQTSDGGLQHVDNLYARA